MAAVAFSETITLTRAEPGLWHGESDPAYANGMEGVFIGQFGGWVTAALFKAAAGDAPEGQSVRALSAHFFTPVRPGALSVRVRSLRKGKTVSFLQADLMQGESVRAQAVATVGTGREDQYARHFAPRPDAPPADTEGLPKFSPPTPFGRSLEARYVKGAPFMGDEAAHSVFWARSAAPTRFDGEALAMLSDYMPPRVFFASNNFIASSTLTLNLYIHGSPDEIAAVGERHVLVDVQGRRISGGYWDHTASFWSPDGALLSTTEQIALHRG